MRIAVTGTKGQIARALKACAAAARDVDGRDASACEVIAVGRPELDLATPDSIFSALRPVAPDVIVNAAAYTDVDQAEAEPDLADRVNGVGAGAVAAAAQALGAPIVQLSTDYVFDGAKDAPYVESDEASAINAYGRSKLHGERAVAAANARHAILRTSWVYDAVGRNFVTTMLRLAATRDEINVVGDQIGALTFADDIARGVLRVARHLAESREARLHGVFHMTAQGEASWAEIAERLFARSAAAGGPTARVVRIASSQYPVAAPRPLNSRLACDKIERVHGVRLPVWTASLAQCVDAILGASSRRPEPPARGAHQGWTR